MISTQNAITVSTLLIVAAAVILGLDDGVIWNDFRSGDKLKTTSNILLYVGLASTDEVTLRLSSFIGGMCGYAMTLLNVDGINWAHVAIQTPLMFLAGYSTYCVLVKKCFEHSLNAKELHLFNTYFLPHGLTKKEFIELLHAGVEWREGGGSNSTSSNSSSISSSNSVGNVVQLTTEGETVQHFCLITEGTFVVICDGEEVATLQEGTFVGESSFVKCVDSSTPFVHPVATATVRSKQGTHVKYVEWNAKKLKNLIKTNSELKACIMTVIAAKQADKLYENTKTIVRSASKRNPFKRQKTTFC